MRRNENKCARCGVEDDTRALTPIGFVSLMVEQWSHGSHYMEFGHINASRNFKKNLPPLCECEEHIALGHVVESESVKGQASVRVDMRNICYRSNRDSYLLRTALRSGIPMVLHPVSDDLGKADSTLISLRVSTLELLS